MKPKQFAGLSLALVITLLSTNVTAQENEKEFSKTAQFTFAYPLGTNGTDATSVSNNFSFNALYGLNGGLDGIEIGGIMNYNKGDVSGFQLADINNALGDFTGVQMGVINYAKGLKGVQIGLINIVGEDNGAVPIGLINIVKGGHYELELLAGDAIHTNLNYKMGVEHFYTIFKLGLGEHVSLVAGPSFNFYVSEVMVDDKYGTLRVPYDVHTSINENNQKWMYLSEKGLNGSYLLRL